MAEVILTQGYVALIDDVDLDRVSKFKWYPTNVRCGGVVYVSGNIGHGRKGRHYVYLHRFILEAKPGQTVDHINGDPLDNRRANLRLVSRSQNNFNQRKRKNSKSEFRGVSYNYKNGPTKKWEARGMLGGVTVFRKGCATEAEAAQAYNEWAIASGNAEYIRPNQV